MNQFGGNFSGDLELILHFLQAYSYATNRTQEKSTKRTKGRNSVCLITCNLKMTKHRLNLYLNKLVKKIDKISLQEIN